MQLAPTGSSMDELAPRLRAGCDLSIAEVREQAGRHEYDGQIQDLSADSVQAGPGQAGRCGRAGRRGRPARGGALAAFERRLRVSFGDLKLHRSNPLAAFERDGPGLLRP